MTEHIEREAALQALCEAVHAKDGKIPCRNQLVSCLWAGTRTQEYAEKILAVPAADVAPVVHGHWRTIPMACYGGGTIREYSCSVCEEHQVSKSPYCPNCGARME